MGYYLNNVRVTRPRRFGKSVMATMIGAYFGKGADAACVFDELAIADDPRYGDDGENTGR